MTIEDSLLPAAVHLTGNDVAEVLRPAVDASGGELLSCRTSHVQYRPQSDLVVRFRCEIRRDGATATETILAATTSTGPPAGTVPVVAETQDGAHVSVGVWRWPYDPILVDLAEMVTPHLAARQLAGLVGGTPVLEVVAYRPCERAVVRVRGANRELYVKVVPPTTTASLADRHAALRAGGLPVPGILAVGSGWLAMEAITGTTLRDRLKHGTAPLPPAERYRVLLDALALVQVGDSPPVRSRLDDAPHHAAMLAAVLPDARGRLADIVARLRAAQSSSAISGTVHGDLHEAQLVVDDDRIVGLLDVDDAGPGEPIDDVATLLAHLRFRGVTGPSSAIDTLSDELRAVVGDGHDPAALDGRIAAVLVGLATGPFRLQQDGWATTTDRILELVDGHLAAAERTIPAPAR